MAEMYTAFPDSRMPYDAIIAEGNTVAIRHSFRGTHKAELQGIPPSGKSVVMPATVILRVVEGKAVEGWLNADFLGMMQQLGVVPPLGQTS